MRTIALFVVALAALVAASPSASSLSGTWSGMIPFQGAPLLYVITFAQRGGTLAATASSPYQGGTEIPVDDVRLDGTHLHFGIARYDYSFGGIVGDERIAGTFTQHGKSYPLTFLPSALGTSTLDGTWLGALHVTGTSLLLGFHFTHAADGALSATLDSPFQHAYGIAANASERDGTLTVSIAQLRLTYVGTIGTQTISGEFTQGASTLPLTLARPGSGALLPAPPPPPTPYPLAPAHYSSRNVTFASVGAVLSGTLTVPSVRHGRVAAFIFVHGSGPENRNGPFPQNPTFLDLANALSNAGYAVLRYDKRGIGKSTGTPTEHWRPLSDDVRAAIAFLRRQPGVDPKRIVLVGHSEGGLIVPLVASANAHIEGIVLMAPPAIPLAQILQEQRSRMPPAVWKEAQRAFSDYVGIDPANVIKRVNVPILLLQGTRDIQVLPSDLHHLTDAAPASHRRITVDILDGDDHLFLFVPPGEAANGTEYAKASPLDPRVARDIERWMRANRL